MCRFIGYIGKKIHLSDLIFKPQNSLIKQSLDASESETQVNGDGFGLGWYLNLEEEPVLYKSRQPAWNDQNLKNIANKLSSHSLVSHIRAATAGEVSRANCHPFQYKKLLMVHNGTINGFNTIKRHLRSKLRDDIYDWVQGQTDSEHFFALFLNNLTHNNTPITEAKLASCMQTTLAQLQELAAEHAPQQPFYLNTIITDGHHLITTRYVSDDNLTANSLYYATGNYYECVDNQQKIHGKADDHHMILVASEILSAQNPDWKTVPQNTMLAYKEGHAPMLEEL